MSLFYVQIKNWNEFQERQTRHNYTWFKFSNSYFSHPKLYSLSNGARIAFIFLMCERSKQSDDIIEINIDLVAAQLKTTPEKIAQEINELIKIGVVLSEDGGNLPAIYRESADITRESGQPDKIRLDKIRLDKKNTSTADAVCFSNFDLESVYQKYPRKLGKAIGMKSISKQIKTQEDFDAFAKAVENYAKACVDLEEKYIKHFSTFVGSVKSGNPWREYIEYTPSGGKQSMDILEMLSSGDQKL